VVSAGQAVLFKKKYGFVRVCVTHLPVADDGYDVNASERRSVERGYSDDGENASGVRKTNTTINRTAMADDAVVQSRRRDGRDAQETACNKSPRV